MYVEVKLLKGFKKILTYKLSSNLENSKEIPNIKDLIGKIISVPIKNSVQHAIILKTKTNRPAGPFKIRETLDLSLFPEDKLYHKFTNNISKFYFVNQIHFYQRVQNLIYQTDTKKRISPLKKQIIEAKPKETFNVDVKLTTEQQSVVDYVAPGIEKKTYKPVLLHGVTASGKTEVYKTLIIKNFEKLKTTILLHPEVSLSMQFQKLLTKQLPPNIPIFGFHSATKNVEKKEMWKSIIENKPILILGVHLPILLPINNLGLIIVDEEHEKGFLEKKHPKLNSKEISIWRAKFYNIPILLGSATPSINSLYNVKTLNWKLFTLKNI